MFTDRIQAGSLLASKLRPLVKKEALVLGIPRGGVPVAYAVAHSLGLPLGLLLVKKIGHPLYPEYGIGAVSRDDIFVFPDAGVSDHFVKAQAEKIRKRLDAMEQVFGKYITKEEVAGKTVIIVDDGIATGYTIFCAIQLLKKKHPERIIVAAPVASRESVMELRDVADNVVILLIPEMLTGVGAYYADFHQMTDQEVAAYLEQYANERNELVDF